MRVRIREYEGIQFAPALAMAIVESVGIRELLDRESMTIDASTRNLTTGMAAKAMIGTMFTEGQRKPLYRVRDQYDTAPVDKMFGIHVTHRTLSDTNLAARLDVIYEMDREEILWTCYSMFCDRFGMSSNMYRFDGTNFPFYGVDYWKYEEGTKPMYSKNSKNRRYDLLQKNVQAICDGNGVLVSARCYDGNVSDTEMNRGSLDFLGKHIDCSQSYVCADCKLATSESILRMNDMDLGFVTKCPLYLGNKIHDDVVRSALLGEMDESQEHQGRFVYDTHAEVELNGRMVDLRFVAYRLPHALTEAKEFYRTNGLSDMESKLVSLKRERFFCVEDAGMAFQKILGSGYGDVFESDVDIWFDERIHAREPDGPCWRAYYKGLRINEERLDAVAREYSVNVLVTNLPFANESHENLRFGATADDLVDVYLGEFTIERVFRVGKTGFGVNHMFIHSPARQDSVIFLTSIATMISETVNIVLKDLTLDGKHPLTMEQISNRMANTIVTYDRDTDTIDILGNSKKGELAMEILERLNIDPGLLIGH